MNATTEYNLTRSQDTNRDPGRQIYDGGPIISVQRFCRTVRLSSEVYDNFVVMFFYLGRDALA